MADMQSWLGADDTCDERTQFALVSDQNELQVRVFFQGTGGGAHNDLRAEVAAHRVESDY
jgi:hypothetical protein